MRIGVISDTHGNIQALNKALAIFEGADLIVHAGDVLYHPPKLPCGQHYDVRGCAEALNSSNVPILIAQGNCDPQVYEELLDMPVQSPYAYTSLDGCRLLVNHGHLLTTDQMIDLARRYKAHYFISGHTHIPVLDNQGDLVLVNPGSPAHPKYELNGQPVPTVGLITDDGPRIINIADSTPLLTAQPPTPST